MRPRDVRKDVKNDNFYLFPIVPKRSNWIACAQTRKPTLGTVRRRTAERVHHCVKSYRNPEISSARPLGHSTHVYSNRKLQYK